MSASCIETWKGPVEGMPLFMGIKLSMPPLFSMHAAEGICWTQAKET